MKKRGQVIIAVLMTALLTYFITTYIYFGVPFYKPEFANTAKYMKVTNLLKNYYYLPEKVKSETLLEGSLKGLTAATEDPYTEYYNKKEFQEFLIESRGTYYGIGVRIDASGEFIQIVTVFKDSPASKVGLKPGDKIVKVNGKDMTSKDVDRAVSMMRGQKGTSVVVTIMREGVQRPFDVKIIRDEIKIDTVSYEMLKDNIGYIKILSFDENTPSDFKNALASLRKSNMKGLIVDLRYNPGGLLDSVLDVTSNFLKKGQLVVYLKDRFDVRQDYKALFDGDVNLPMVVVVNGYSASASEIFAGCLKDLKRATIVGEKTYGKGVVQQVFDLKDGSALKMTVSQYFTPSGNTINKKGVKPDVEVKPAKGYENKLEIPLDKDIQLQKAIEVIKQKM